MHRDRALPPPRVAVQPQRAERHRGAVEVDGLHLVVVPARRVAHGHRHRAVAQRRHRAHHLAALRRHHRRDRDGAGAGGRRAHHRTDAEGDDRRGGGDQHRPRTAPAARRRPDGDELCRPVVRRFRGACQDPLDEPVGGLHRRSEQPEVVDRVRQPGDLLPAAHAAADVLQQARPLGPVEGPEDQFRRGVADLLAAGINHGACSSRISPTYARRNFCRPARMRVLAVPNGMRSIAATSTAVYPV